MFKSDHNNNNNIDFYLKNRNSTEISRLKNVNVKLPFIKAWIKKKKFSPVEESLTKIFSGHVDPPYTPTAPHHWKKKFFTEF